MERPAAYERIADRLRDRIRDGTYPVGDRLPSVRELADAEGVSDTVTRAVYRLLVQEGLVERRPRSGHYVRSVTGAGAVEIPDDVYEDLVERADAAGVPLAEYLEAALRRHLAGGTP